MMNPIRTLALLVFLPAAALPAGDDAFRYKYEANKKSSYSMSIKTTMDMQMDGQPLMKMVVEMRFRFNLTPTGEMKETFSVLKLEPSDLEGDWDIVNSGTHIILKLHKNGRLVGTSDGTTIVDTEKDTGKELADNFKKEIVGLTLNGLVDTDARGVIKDYRGDEPFVKFWKDVGQEQFGLFGITFPERAVPANGKWEEPWFLKKMGTIILEGEGLKCLNKYERLPDATHEGRPVSAFSLSSPFDGKDLVGNMEQGEQKIRIEIQKFVRTGTGKFLFDNDRGLLVRADIVADGDAKMKCKIGEQTVNMDLKVKADMKTVLDAK